MLLCYSHQHISLKRLFYHPQEGSVCVEIRVLRMKYSHQHAPSFQKCYKFKIANPVVSDRVIQQRKSSNSQYLLAGEKDRFGIYLSSCSHIAIRRSYQKATLITSKKGQCIPTPQACTLTFPTALSDPPSNHLHRRGESTVRNRSWPLNYLKWIPHSQRTCGEGQPSGLPAFTSRQLPTPWYTLSLPPASQKG